MGLKVRFAQGKFPENVAELSRAFEATQVEPDPGTVTVSRLAPDTIDLIDATAQTAASAAEAAAVATATTLASSAQTAAVTAANATSSSALAAHIADSDPHPVYTTALELTAAISAHEGAANPHAVYLTQTEGDARYLQLTLSLFNAVDDAAASAGGVAVGRLYRNGSVVMIRVA